MLSDVPTDLLAIVGSFLPTDDRLVLRQTGRSFRRRFESAIESGCGPGWIDESAPASDLLGGQFDCGCDITAVDYCIRCDIRLVADAYLPFQESKHLTAVEIAADDLRSEPRKSWQTLFWLRRLRSAAASAVENNDIWQAVSAIEADLATDTGPPFLSRRLRIAASFTFISLLLAITAALVVNRRPEVMDCLPDWLVVLVFSCYAVEIVWSIKRLPSFARGWLRRLDLDESDGFRTFRRLSRCIGIGIPVCLLLLPATLLEFRRFSIDIPIAVPEVVKASSMFISTIERELDGSSVPNDRYSVYWMSTIVLFCFIGRPVPVIDVWQFVATVGTAAVVFGSRADVVFTAVIGCLAALVLSFRIYGFLRRYKVIENWLELIVSVIQFVLFLVPPTIAAAVGELQLPIPRIGSIRLALWSIETADWIIGGMLYTTWFIILTIWLHRLFESRGYRSPMARWYFWTFLVRSRGFPADRFPFDRPYSISQLAPRRFLPICFILAHLRHVYPAVKTVIDRTNGSWLAAMLRQPIGGYGGLLSEIVVSTVLCWSTDWSSALKNMVWTGIVWFFGLNPFVEVVVVCVRVGLFFD